MKIAVFFLSILCFTCLHAENPPIKIEISSNHYSLFHWSTENGLPQNNVHKIRQDANGFLWISTYDGIARFDGSGFTNFDDGNIQGLDNSIFLQLEEDKHHDIWFTTNNQLGKISNGQIKAVYDFGDEHIEIINNGANLFLKRNSELILLDSSLKRIQMRPDFDQFERFSNDELPTFLNQNELITLSENLDMTPTQHYEYLDYLGSNYLKMEDTNGQKSILKINAKSLSYPQFTFPHHLSRFNC